MATHVYANDLEIACKSADGQASPAFPDPCWSPPSPAAGPVVLPYPNTAFAPDLSNGTTTVFIVGKEIAVEDKAYFSTSTGNEPATQAFSKGFQTSVIKGKAYFRAWSLDVVFEGLGVDRHLDSVSHNHGSMPSNTPLFPYLSRSFFGGHDCKDEQKRIERACGKESDHSDSRKAVGKHSKVGQMLRSKRKGQSGVGRRGGDKWHWTDDHCDGLNVALDSAEKAKEYAKELEQVYKNLPNELNILGALESELKDMALHAAGKAAAKVAVKAGAKQLAGSSIPVAGNIAMGIWSAVDAAMAVGDVAEIQAVASESLDQLKVLKDKMSSLSDVAKKFDGFSQLPPDQQLSKAQEIATEGQDILATLNPCTRARKCNLVPYKADGAGNPFNAKGRSQVESANGGGCCPGQTGHHLIYGAMAKSGCPNYNHDVAPTVCVEGTSQNFGSHGRVHDAMDREVGNLAKAGKIPNGTMTPDQAIEAGANSHKEAFPASGCSKACIKAQLQSYYGQMCRGGSLSAVDKNGNPVVPGRGASQR